MISTNFLNKRIISIPKDSFISNDSYTANDEQLY